MLPDLSLGTKSNNWFASNGFSRNGNPATNPILCFGFNATAAEIWRLSAAPISLGNLISRMVETFDVTREQCAAETRATLSELHEDGLTWIEKSEVSALEFAG